MCWATFAVMQLVAVLRTVYAANGVRHERIPFAR
jgi:hypothetical protein